MNKRTVELGICTKHPSEGRCAHLGHTSCASCPKLCTGKKWLSSWEQLAKDTGQLLSQLQEKYRQLGIPEEEYITYVEFRQETKAYERYQTVINAIKNGG